MKIYNERLPNHRVIDQEVRLWKIRYYIAASDERPTSLAALIKELDEGRFPNLLLLLKTGCTLLVTSWKCETSFPTWLRYSMTNSNCQR